LGRREEFEDPSRSAHCRGKELKEGGESEKKRSLNKKQRKLKQKEIFSV